MTENTNLEPNAQPKAEEQENETKLGDTTPDNGEKEILIPVKFNKEIINLNFEEATQLAQKGLKFDLISKEYDDLKQLAKGKGQSVTEFLKALKAGQIDNRKSELLEKCGGNEELALHIFELESKALNDDEMGFSEVKEQFPELKSISDLPESVIESAKLKGTLLLDELLRYKLGCQRAAMHATSYQQAANLSSTGSQIDRKDGLNPETYEFLKGLWKQK